MYLTLRPDVSPGMYQGKACLFVGDITSYLVSDVSLAVLAGCNGAVTEADLADQLAADKNLDRERAQGYVSQVVERYEPFLSRSEQPQSVEVKVVTDRPKHMMEKGAPAVVHWVVTEYCPRSCVYCIRNARWGWKPLDSVIETQRALEIIDICGAMAMKRFYFDGGEPLLRPDILQLCKRVTDHRADISLVTRFRIDESLAGQLAEAGLKKILYSLDSPDPDVADMMSGVPGFFAEAVFSIRNLVGAGIEVEVAPVVGRCNVDSLGELEQLATDLGVSSMAFSGLGVSSRSRYVVDLTMSKEDRARFLDWYRGPHELPVSMIDGEPGSEGGTGTSKGCAVGRTCLVISPAGDVCLCDKELELTAVGSVLTQDPDDIWFSEAVDAIRYPRHEEFSGTPCFGCGLFEDCNQKGRCLWSAHEEYGKFAAPCRFCLDPSRKKGVEA